MLILFFYIALILIGAHMAMRPIIRRKEEPKMIDVYVALIVGGKRKMAQVPARYQGEVTELLAAIGLDGDGNALV